MTSYETAQTHTVHDMTSHETPQTHTVHDLTSYETPQTHTVHDMTSQGECFHFDYMPSRNILLKF